ncbi:bone morphogenetic protein 6-like [Chanodichthys erythropterus]|uniref:bone morphogenetic protein 6-like n=1 Tax=Chanodichthys erythropterus TaxID=933992 RepID=UPI00351EFDD2
MRLVLCVAVVLFGLPLGKMFVLHPSPEASSSSSSSSSSSAVKTKRCRGELEIRKVLLESLNLQQEPRVSVSWMSLLREQWRDSLKSAVPSSTGNSSIPGDSGNSTCCKYSSQVFMKDLGWDRWVVYPESVTFVQCRTCGPSVCAESASAQCCKPTAHDIVPFVYVDEWSSLVLSSARLTRECGCDTQEPEVTTPS